MQIGSHSVFTFGGLMHSSCVSHLNSSESTGSHVHYSSVQTSRGPRLAAQCLESMEARGNAKQKLRELYGQGQRWC